jgi:hypothetical protein
MMSLPRLARTIGDLGPGSRCLLAAWLVMTIGGCQFAPSKPSWPTSWFKKDQEPGVPDRMMVVWSDTVMHQPSKPGVRGFGGRIYFYRGNETDPIPVDGKLSVYAYDGDGSVDDPTKPLKKYVFTEDQFLEHMSHTDIGPSFSIWLPWDQIGGETRQISLVTRFDGRTGGVVISKPSMKLLPGVAAKKRDRTGESVAEKSVPDRGSVRLATAEVDAAEHLDSGVRLAAGEEPSPEDAPPAAAIATPRRGTLRSQAMTIDLPPNFQRHLIAKERSDSDAAADRGSDPSAASSLRSAGNTTTPSGTAPSPAAEDEPATEVTATSRSGFRNFGPKRSTTEPSAGSPDRRAGWLEKTPRNR